MILCIILVNNCTWCAKYWILNNVQISYNKDLVMCKMLARWYFSNASTLATKCEKLVKNGQKSTFRSSPIIAAHWIARVW